MLKLKTAPLLLAYLCSFLAISGCKKQGFETGRPWNPEETLFFDDGVDVVTDFADLSGSWRQDEERRFDARVQLADVIAEVEILSVQTTTDLERASAKRIGVRILHIRYGEMPAEPLSLVSTKNSPGYALILRHEARLHGRLFLFMRWFKTKNGELANHFHLSPVSQSMERELKSRIGFRKRAEKSMGEK